MSYIRTTHHGPYTLHSYLQSAYEIEAPKATVWIEGEDARALYDALDAVKKRGFGSATAEIEAYLPVEAHEKESSLHPL